MALKEDHSIERVDSIGLSCRAKTVLVLLLFKVLLAVTSATAQQLEPLLINGQPALKYRDKNECESPINYGKIGGHEEAVTVRVSHFHSAKWGEKGWLGITRNRIFFAPDADQASEHAFSIPRNEFKEAKVSTDGKVSYLTLTSKIKKNQEFAVACFGKILDVDDMFIPVLTFAVLASNDFDAGVKEFERLTATLHQKPSEQDRTLADLLGPNQNVATLPLSKRTDAGSDAASDDPNQFFNLGKTHLKLSLYTEAIKAFKQAIQIKVDFAEAHNGLGEAYLYSGRPDEAIGAYTEAIRLNPNYAEAYNGLGIAYADTYQPEESLKALKQAIRLRPDFSANHYFAGLTYKKLGKRKEAIEALKQAIRLHPKFADAWNNLGDIYFNIKDYDAAAEVYRALVKLKPDSVDAHSRLANSLFYLGKHQDAITEYELSIKLSPNDPSGYHNLGNTFANMGRFDEAITNYKKAIAIKSDYVPSHFMLGRAYLKKGDKASATQEYNVLKSLDPNVAKLLMDEISK